MANSHPYAYLHLAVGDTPAETVLRAFPAELGNIVVNTGAAGTLIIRDALATGGSVVVLDLDTTTAQSLAYDLQLNNGLTYAKTGAADITITYR